MVVTGSNFRFAKTFSKTLIAMQDHVAKKKGKFMSSHGRYYSSANGHLVKLIFNRMMTVVISLLLICPQ